MTRQAMLKKIQSIIRELCHDESMEISEATTFQEDLTMDSIALMEFIISLEDAFDLTIPDEAIEDLETIGEVLDYLLIRLS